MKQIQFVFWRSPYVTLLPCVTVYLAPPGQLAPPPGGKIPWGIFPPPWAACSPPQKTWQTQFKMIFIFFYITNLYHTIIRTVVMHVFHYFTFYGRRLALRYCSLSIFLPISEVLVDTVQKDILSLLIEFPIEQVIREFPVSDITYLSSNRKGQGLRYPGLGSLHLRGWIPWPGQLTPHPW